jgi:hypothetical protein
LARRPAETLTEYAGRLSRHCEGLPTDDLRYVVELVTAAAYAGKEPSADERATAEASFDSLRAHLRRHAADGMRRRRRFAPPATAG